MPTSPPEARTSVEWQIQTPTGTSGAIAIIQLSGSPADLDVALHHLHLSPLGIGQVALRNLLDVDTGLIARWSASSVHLFPHGGAAVMRLLAGKLERAGFEQADLAPEAVYPEATSRLEARMLTALARAASPLAVDLLLAQPGRWASHPPPNPSDHRHRLLSRLIHPPLVVAIGPSNIGKSSLLNAMAGRGVSLVADQPGTTRDHVGALIDMAGLVVRYIDTPGIREGPEAIESEAVELAAEVARTADLILSCGDATSPPLDTPPGKLVVRAALRADLGEPSWDYHQAVSIVQKRGLAELVRGIRDALVPPDLLSDDQPWAFWP